MQIGVGMKCGWESNAVCNVGEMWMGMQCRLEWGYNVGGNAMEIGMGM